MKNKKENENVHVMFGSPGNVQPYLYLNFMMLLVPERLLVVADVQISTCKKRLHCLLAN